MHLICTDGALATAARNWSSKEHQYAIDSYSSLFTRHAYNERTVTVYNIHPELYACNCAFTDACRLTHALDQWLYHMRGTIYIPCINF